MIQVLFISDLRDILITFLSTFYVIEAGVLECHGLYSFLSRISNYLSSLCEADIQLGSIASQGIK